MAQNNAQQEYVAANLLSIFYHEFGHALIDVLALPIFGQEEDAADTASVILIDALFEEEAAQSIVRDAAFGFLDEAAQLGRDDPPWWDEHGPDQQRYFNLVCQFYGADPDARQELAHALELPPERAEGCADEFDLAIESWGPVLDEITDAGPGNSLTVAGVSNGTIRTLLESEVADLNAEMTLPADLEIIVEACDEANAYYDPELRQITMCLELEPHLNKLFAQQ